MSKNLPFYKYKTGQHKYKLGTSHEAFGIIADVAKKSGAQWLSGRVLDSRPRGHGVEPHRHHCVVVLEQDTFILA